MFHPPLSEETIENVTVEVLAGMKQVKIAKRNKIAKRTVRQIALAARREEPELTPEAASALRNRIMARVDRMLEEGLGLLDGPALAEMKPEKLARVLADVARVRRDITSADGPQRTPPPFISGVPIGAPATVIETVDDWNARHARPDDERPV